MKKYPMLKMLEDAQIVEFNVLKSKRICQITERCDDYMTKALTKDEMLKLVNELSHLVSQMKD